MLHLDRSYLEYNGVLVRGTRRRKIVIASVKLKNMACPCRCMNRTQRDREIERYLMFYARSTAKGLTRAKPNVLLLVPQVKF